MSWDLERAYREHLTTADLAVLAEVGGDRRLDAVLASPELDAVVFGENRAPEQLGTVSPFLTFAVAIHRTAERLATATYVEEWIGPRQRLPVFAVQPLRDLLADPVRRYYLIELLSSYTHVVSGSTWQQTRRGWRRRRFSELDPVHLVELLESVAPTEVSGVLRRLGDLALFLTGVFPDHTANTTLGRASAEVRLLRSAGIEPEPSELGTVGPFELLERLGARWYRLAVQRAVFPSANVQVLESIAEHFTHARRILNVVTDTYLFPLRDLWFGRPAA
jgi:hypothetical protein